MEWRRWCYQSEWALYPNDLSRRVKGRYYWAPDDAPFLPRPHYLGSSRYLEEDPQRPVLGEPWRPKRKRTNGLLPFEPPPAIVVGSGRGDMTADYPAGAISTVMIAGIDARCWIDAGLPTPPWMAPVQTSHTLAMFSITTGVMEDSPIYLRDDGVIVIGACVELDCLRFVVRSAPSPEDGVTIYYLAAPGQLHALQPDGTDTTVGYYAVAEHVAEADPHPGYLTPAEGAIAYDPAGAATAAIVAHEAAGDPHPDYLTLAEADGEYDPLGAAAAAIVAHEGAADPHPGYLTPAEGDTRYDLSGVAARTEGTLAATGSTQGTAAAIVTDAVVVSGADGTKGVVLRDTTAGLIVVYNSVAGQSLKVYPPSGATISVNATNLPDSVFGLATKIYARVSANRWWVVTLI